MTPNTRRPDRRDQAISGGSLLHDLAALTGPPTEEAALDALAKVFGSPAAADLWRIATDSLGLSRPVRADQLGAVAGRLVELAEVLRVAGRSLNIRVAAHQTFS